ncbi:MAG: hypothetical protein ACTHMS_01620 [Jatrophihabitans sp.]|uniref:hypothetical protein n=1 Tax=Jatrophihabitans sp. TaxID=1932789 RepID=UPI003F818003
MAGATERTPAIVSPAHPDDFVVSELLGSEAGAHSPFGPEMIFPLPVEKLHYVHPGPESRPNLAGDH